MRAAGTRRQRRLRVATPLMLGHPFHHVGIACADIEATGSYAREAFEIVSDSGTVEDPIQNARVRLFNEGLPRAFELVCGPAVEGLVRRGVTYYHVCYTTSDIEATMQRAKKLGAVTVSPPQPAVLFGGRRVSFMY